MEQKKPRKSGKPWVLRCNAELARQEQITIERIFAELNAQTPEEKARAAGLDLQKMQELCAWMDEHFL